MGVETVSYTVLVFVKQVPDTQNISGDAMTPEGTARSRRFSIRRI